MSITKAHQFIHSLSRGEKKRFSSSLKKSVVHQLYQQLNAIELLDEKHLKNLKKIYSKDDPDYLISLILKSMRNYTAGSEHTQIKALILDARFLLKKDFYRLCFSKLQKAKAKAQKLYSHFDILEINALLLELVHLVRGDQFFHDKIQLAQLLAENTLELQKLNDFLVQKDLHHQLLVKVRHSFPIKDLSEIQLLKEKFYAKIQSKNSSSEIAHYHALQAKHLYYLLIGDNQHAQSFNQTALYWWEKTENQSYKKENQYRYIQTLLNALSENLLILMKAKSADTSVADLETGTAATLEKIKVELDRSNPLERSKVLPAYYRGCLNFYSVVKDPISTRRIIDELETKNQLRKQFKLSDQIIFLTQYAGFYFGTNNFLVYKKWVAEFEKIAESLPAKKTRLEIALMYSDVFASFALSEKRKKTIREKKFTRRVVKIELEKRLIDLKQRKVSKNGFPFLLFDHLTKILQIDKNEKDAVFKERKALKHLSQFLSDHPTQLFSAEMLIWLEHRLN